MRPLTLLDVFYWKRCFVVRLFAYGIAILLSVVIAFNSSAEAAETEGLPINSDGVTYDSHPSAAVDADGSTWIAWHAYHNGKDRILARSIDTNNNPSELFTVSEAGTAHSPPVIVPVADTIWVIWSAYSSGKWVVTARRFANGIWQPAAMISKPGTDGIYPTGAEIQDNKLLVSWSGYESGRFRICTRVFEGEKWQPSLAISSDRHDAWRPQIAVIPSGQAWVVWDEYTGSHYRVQGRSVLPKLAGIEAISPPGEHCLNPTALATGDGLFVAWLRKVDVVGGPGVISQLHTLNAARRTFSGWRHIIDANGDRAAAELTHGLMAKIDPRPVATGGYLGRRTQPMLIEANGSVWLLWERKSDHKGITWKVSGDLIGRPVQDGRWQKPVTIHHGLVDYHVIDPPRSADSQIAMLASQLPRRTRRLYHRITCDLSKVDGFQQDEWGGWSPVALPVADETTERHELKIGEKTFKLYWADLHCHSGLTADAEGEPDELMHYARDRALLDVVVFTNNDFIYDVPLTQYEYALSNFFAKTYTQADFLAFPGYEWTSRVPGVTDARVSDPGNWTPPYKHKSYPNHRSVIYPPEGGPLLHYPEVANDIATLNAVVARAGGVTLTQHDAFQTSGHPVEVAMELTSGWRRYIARRPNLFHEPLNKGLRLGFVACGDTHRRAPGLSGALTGIYAEELTSESILNALRARRCFATSGSRIILESRVNDSLMGGEVNAADGRAELKLLVIGTRPILSVTLIRDGRELKAFSGNGRRKLSLTYSEKGLSSGTHWYYWRVAQTPETPDLPGNLNPAFGHLAWSSPHWVIVE